MPAPIWLLAWLMVATALWPAATAAQPVVRPYAPQADQAVSILDPIWLLDDDRKRLMSLKVYYPNGRGPYPVILFSPDAGESRESYRYFGSFLARCGYVVILLGHPDGDAASRSKEGSTDDPYAWGNRPRDLSFLIDKLPDLARRLAPLHGKLLLHRLAIAGHALGAHTTLELAGSRVDRPGQPATSFGDQRVTCFLAMSPPGPGRYGLQPDSWNRIKGPVMLMTGTYDLVSGGRPGWRLIPFVRMPPGDKYAVWLTSANQQTFAEHGLYCGELLPYIELAAAAFMDAYLKGSPRARKFLQNDGLRGVSAGLATVTFK